MSKTKEQKKDRLNSSSLSENLITLACFDDEVCSYIKDVIDPDLYFSPIYTTIAEYAYDFIESYGEAPKDHLPDMLEDVLEKDTDYKKKSAKGKQYTDTLLYIRDTYESGINKDYVLGELNIYLKHQSLKWGIAQAAEAIQDGDTEQAEEIIRASLESKDDLTDMGMVLNKFGMDEFEGLFKDPDEEDVEYYYIGIDALYHLEIGPAKGELFTFLAPPNSGKSFFLVSAGRYCCLHRQCKVLHVTLEMSETKTMRRYVQGFNGMYSEPPKNPIVTTQFKYNATDELTGRKEYTGLEYTEFNDNLPSFANKTAIPKVFVKNKKLSKRHKNNLVVKQFPTNALKFSQLNAYMNSLERVENFIPDVLIVDYADIMQIDSSNVRTSTGDVYKQLRQIAVERNIAVITATQTNRAALDSPKVNLKHLSEDFSKAAISDNIVTFSQTEDEKAGNNARLFVAKARDKEMGQTIEISQNYAVGQFCIDSHVLSSSSYEISMRDKAAMVNGGMHEPSNNSEGNTNNSPRNNVRGNARNKVRNRRPKREDDSDGKKDGKIRPSSTKNPAAEKRTSRIKNKNRNRSKEENGTE